MCYERLALELDSFAADPDPDLDDAFALCRAVIKLKAVYELIDRRYFLINELLLLYGTNEIKCQAR